MARNRCLLSAVTAAALLAGCANAKPAEFVSLRASCSPMLSRFDASPHAMDVYVYSIDDPAAFLAAEPRELRRLESRVPGGYSERRFVLGPGETVEIHLHPTGTRYLGVAATLPPPTGLVREVAEIPTHGRLALTLDDREIHSFAPDESE